MKQQVRRVAVVTGLAVFALGLAAGQALASKGLKWQTDLKKAQTQAAREKKILMLDFTAEW